jgi:hypothetical protein
VQVYKTVSKGWACRSWDFIPAGSPICEYFGILRKNDENLESMVDNGYIFELDLMQTMQGMEGREVTNLYFIDTPDPASSNKCGCPDVMQSLIVLSLSFHVLNLYSLCLHCRSDLVM